MVVHNFYKLLFSRESMVEKYEISRRGFLGGMATMLAGCGETAADIVDDILDGRVRYEVERGNVQYDLSQRLVELQNGSREQGRATEFRVTTKSVGEPRAQVIETYFDAQSDGELDNSGLKAVLIGPDGNTINLKEDLFSLRTQDEYERRLNEMRD
jgi:hypothetical protein